ncbi:MAG: HAD family phosphatase [Acidobacteria bacterium]|nr:HAD family phosphatase [Acidobacteriota bacterium]
MIKAILMDFNGVVIDDESIQHDVYRELFKADGIDVTDEAYYSRLGMDDKRFVASILEEAGKPSGIDTVLELTTAKTQKWRDTVASSMPLFSGIENFIRKMSREFALGLVSMSKREEIDFVLEKAGLIGCFSIIISAEEVSKCKPDPECYRKGFEQIDLVRISQGHLPMTHSECLVIEDSPPGVMAGKRADLQVLGVTNTVSANKLRKAGADWVAKNLDDWMPASIRGAFAAKV